MFTCPNLHVQDMYGYFLALLQSDTHRRRLALMRELFENENSRLTAKLAVAGVVNGGARRGGGGGGVKAVAKGREGPSLMR